MKVFVSVCALSSALGFAYGSAGCKSDAELKRGTTSEAKAFLTKIYSGARQYYMDAPSGGAVMATSQLPASVGPTPALGACCETGGKCAPDTGLWTDASWQALQFAADDPHYYSYEFKVAGDGKSFTAYAYGDLDCDGEFSTYSVTGEVGPDGIGAAPPVASRRASE